MTTRDVEDIGKIGPVPYRRWYGDGFFSGLSWIMLVMAVLIWAISSGAISSGYKDHDAVVANAYATLAIWVAGTILFLLWVGSFYRRHMAMLLLIHAKAAANPAISPEQAAKFVDGLMGKRVKP